MHPDDIHDIHEIHDIVMGHELQCLDIFVWIFCDAGQIMEISRFHVLKKNMCWLIVMPMMPVSGLTFEV